MSPESAGRDPYLVRSAVHGSQRLSAPQTSSEALPLREIAGRSGLRKRLAFRLLYSRERAGCSPGSANGIVGLALAIRYRRRVPPAVFVNRPLVTPENVDRFYPNDAPLPLTA